MTELHKDLVRQVGFNGAGMFPSQKCQNGLNDQEKPEGFNGAGMFPSQKWQFETIYKLEASASMGPGCFHPRNTERTRIGR